MKRSQRAVRLSWLGEAIHQISESESRAVYEKAVRWLSDEGYSYTLDSNHVSDIESIIVNDDVAMARDWVATRLAAERENITVVFGPYDVFWVPVETFLEHWQDMFGPGDDVLITSHSEAWILFYYHEDELHYGRIIPHVPMSSRCAEH